MVFLIYETQNLINQTQKDNNLRIALENFKKHLKKCTDANEVRERLNARRDDILTYNIWKKRIAGKFRLIIKEENIGNNSVFIFSKIYKRDEQEYDEFIVNPYIRELSNAEREEIKRKLDSLEEIEQPIIHDEIFEWTELPDLNFTINIFESNKWVNEQTPEFKRHWKSYHNILKNILTNEELVEIIPLKHSNFNNVYIASAAEKREHIVYKEFSKFNQLKNEIERCIFLIKSISV